MSIDPFTWLADKILQARDARTKVDVLVHEAYLTGDNRPQYFVKVVNLSPMTEFTITHIFAKDGSHEIDILNPQRPLPYTLNKTKMWETWFPKSLINDHNKIFENIYIVLTNGKEYKSRKNKTVRPKGFIAGL
jgi:hypothetical protein